MKSYLTLQTVSSFSKKISICIAVCMACVWLLSGCSSAKVGEDTSRKDDVIRIKPEMRTKFEERASKSKIRDGRTLRGTILEVIIHQNTSGEQDTAIAFIPEGYSNTPENVEFISYAYVQNISELNSIPTDSLRGIDTYESYNITEYIPELRKVPVRKTFDAGSPGEKSQPKKDSCNCEPLDFGVGVSVSCPTRNYQWWFAEIRGVYSVYSDVPRNGISQGRDGWQGEIALGARFGKNNEWGIGMAYTSPQDVFNKYSESLTSDAIGRPTAMLHLRYTFGSLLTKSQRENKEEEIRKANPRDTARLRRELQETNQFGGLGIFSKCWRPFIYGQVGMALDKATINLGRFNFSSSDCSSCNQFVQSLSASGQLPSVDLGLPVSFGLGAGIEIPIVSFMDLAVDIGYRSLAIADEQNLIGFSNIPNRRRVDSFRLRFGLTF